MPPSIVLQKIRQGAAVITAKASYHDPELVELIASSGFDAVWICLEHKRMDPSAVYALIQACRLGGADALIRVRPSNYTDVLHLIEAGARGIMLPRVRHPDEVRDVVQAMKFRPEGARGYDGIHAEAGYGRIPAKDYLAQANRGNYLVVQIEEPDVLPHLDTLAAMPGVDVLFVGPADLTLALDRFGATDDPEVRAILQNVADACQRHGKVAGIPCTPEQVASYHAMGYRFFNVISDYRCVFHGMKAARAGVVTGW